MVGSREAEREKNSKSERGGPESTGMGVMEGSTCIIQMYSRTRKKGLR